MVRIRYIKVDPLANLMIAYTAIRDGHVSTTPADLKALSEATGIPIVTHSEVYRKMADSGSNEEKTGGNTFRERRAEALANYQRIKEDQAKKPKKATDDIVPDGYCAFNLDGFLAGEVRLREDEARLRMSESGRVYVDDEGKVKISGRDRQNTTDGVAYFDRNSGRYTVNPAESTDGLADHIVKPRAEQLERTPIESGFWQRAKEATDDIWVIRNEAGEEVGRVKAGESVTFEKGGIYSVGPAMIGKTWHEQMSENVANPDGWVKKASAELTEKTLADSKCLYSFGVHIDPSTGQPHKNDHICNRQCHLLAKKAQLERNLAAAQHREDMARRELSNAERSRRNTKQKLDIILDELRKSR